MSAGIAFDAPGIWSMNCEEYADRFLSAHADNELSGPERHLVDEHLRSCYRCRAWLAEEQALKADIRHHAGIVKAPADVRLRIRAALGEAAERRPQHRNIFARAALSVRKDTVRRPLASGLLRRAIARRESISEAGPGSAHRWLAVQFQRAQYMAPIGFVVIMLAAATAIFKVSSRSVSGPALADYQKSMPTFDFAIDRFNQLSRGFAPNVPPEAFSQDSGAYFAWVQESDPLRHVSAELPDISVSYEKMQMLPEFCDFAVAGYELAGGRIDRMPNGEPVTYTLYRNQTESILSIGLKKQISAPQGGYWFGSHAFYSYRGYSICLTIFPVGHFASIIVARVPMFELLRNVATSETANWDQ
jgi:hypothetical protein